MKSLKTVCHYIIIRSVTLNMNCHNQRDGLSIGLCYVLSCNFCILILI